VTYVYIAIYTAVALSAARWWMRPLMLHFDQKFELKPCKESDFHFFCWTWIVVVFLMGLYGVWRYAHYPFHWLMQRVTKKSPKNHPKGLHTAK
jgi:hypothetical protein